MRNSNGQKAIFLLHKERCHYNAIVTDPEKLRAKYGTPQAGVPNADDQPDHSGSSSGDSDSNFFEDDR